MILTREPDKEPRNQIKQLAIHIYQLWTFNEVSTLYMDLFRLSWPWQSSKEYIALVLTLTIFFFAGRYVSATPPKCPHWMKPKFAQKEIIMQMCNHFLSFQTWPPFKDEKVINKLRNRTDLILIWLKNRPSQRLDIP